MGMDVDAHIYYGMVTEQEEDYDLPEYPWVNEDEDDDFEGWALRHLGLKPLDYSTYPQIRYLTGQDYTEHRRLEKEAQERWAREVGADAYYERRRELLATVPLEERGGGYQGNITILVLKAAPSFNASYEALPFDPLALHVGGWEDEKASKFLEPFGVKWEPKWLLVPYYG